MKSAVILHSVSDAKHCVLNAIHKDRLLFSTHSSVDVYLREMHALECRCLSKYITQEELMREKKEWIGKVEELIERLDTEIVPEINMRYGFEMRYFTPLYLFIGAYHLLGYVWFVRCLRNIIAVHSIEKILFYDYRTNRYLSASTSVSDLAAIFFSDKKFEIIKIPEQGGPGEDRTAFKTMLGKFDRLKGATPELINNRMKALLHRRRFATFDEKRKTILVSELLYELEFLRPYFSKYNVLYYDFGKDKFIGFDKDVRKFDTIPDLDNSDTFKDTNDPFLKILLKDIKEDLTVNWNRYMGAVSVVEKIHKRYTISAGLWGVSPAWKTRALVFEYLRANKIKTIGAQHGCLYGEVCSPWQFDTDFNRCDYFISWGFTEEDLGRIYPSRQANARILPYGKTEIVRHNKANKKADLLFPVSMSVSLFEGGMDGVLPHKLTERQERILSYLDSLGSSKVYVKPFVGSNYENCSILPLLKRLRNVNVVDNMYLTEFLERYLPKAVLMEVPSQPLFDILPLDTEIFLMGNPMYPYEEKALGELKRRVHYCEDTDEMISMIDLFLKGKLDRKRDQTFYNHYMYKENTKERILDLVNKVIKI